VIDTMPNRRPSQRGETTGSAAGEPISAHERIEFLAHVPLFSELNRRELRTLAQAAIQREYPAGATIVQQGETGVGLYVIIRGRVLVRRQQADGAERQLSALGGGEMFGEMALLDTFPRSASVVAEKATTVLVVPTFGFQALLQDDSPIAIKMLAVLSRRVRQVELADG
jgi:CRP/FNR family transcriptional regulator, cyclic AMP receptor protein